MTGEVEGRLVLVEGKTDLENARLLKEKLIQASAALGAVLDEANREGLVINFGFNVAPGGRNVITNIQILKYFNV